jgi:hypothetical protein
MVRMRMGIRKTLPRIHADEARIRKKLETQRNRKEIAEIADIARNRRNRKSKTLPLINTDYADLKKEKTYRGFTRMSADEERLHPAHWKAG